MNMKFIDIEKTISDKNPGLLKMLPGFVIRYLKRIIHEDELNDLTERFQDEKGLDFIKGVFGFMGIKYRAVGTENIPLSGRYLFASNHPLGGLDGLVFIYEVGKIYPNLKFPVNDLLMNVANLEELFLPVNKHGKQERESVRQIEEAYASDAQILYFPAGLCSRKRHGKIRDLEWKKNFVAKSVRHKRDIIPVYFSGRNSDFFYNLANFRVFMGIKSNFEMVFLPNEMFKQIDKEIIITFGKPIPWTTISKSDLSFQEWSDRLCDLVYHMGKNA